MSRSTIHHIINDPQYFCAKEGDKMDGISQYLFVRTLIRENAEHNNDGYSLFACDLAYSDQRLLLSYVLDAEEFAWACENKTRLNAMLQENEREMQELIDDEIGSVYHEDMREMGAVLSHHRDNGEPFWRIK